MSVSFYVHILELVTCFLTAMLLVQLVRTYRQHSPGNFRSNNLNAALGQSQLDDIPILVDVVASDHAAFRHGAQTASVAAQEMSVTNYLRQPSDGVSDVRSSSAENILDDYIGGFFGEPVAPSPEIDIKAFRAVAEGEAEKIISSAAVNESNTAVPSLQSKKADISPFRASNSQAAESTAPSHEKEAATSSPNPLLNGQIPEELLTDQFIERKKSLDESVVTNNSSNENQAQSKEGNTMSNKAVLAMLEEAKVVSVS